MVDITVVEVAVDVAPTVIEVEVPQAITATEIAVPGQQGPQGPEGPDPWLEPIQTLTGNGALAIDYSLGKHVELTLTGDTTITVTGWPVTQRIARLTLEVINTGSHSITGWPAGTLWPGGLEPEITASGLDMVILTTIDAGTKIYGHIVGQDFA